MVVVADGEWMDFALEILEGIEEISRGAIALPEFGGGAIVAPRPPDLTTLTLIKLLPLFPVVFCKHGRAAINPNLGCFRGSFAAGRTGERVRMTGRFGPRRRSRVKSVHHGVANLQRCVSLIMTCFRGNEGIGNGMKPSDR